MANIDKKVQSLDSITEIQGCCSERYDLQVDNRANQRGLLGKFKYSHRISVLSLLFSVVQQKLHHPTKLMLLACCTLFTCLSLTTLATFASAFGIQKWGSFDIPKIPISIPAGELDHKINGDGNYIESEYAGFTTVTSSLCNWKVDYVYFDVAGVERRRIIGPVNYRCDRNVWAQTVYPGKVPYGKACAALYRSGEYVTRQCHFITE